MAMNKFLLTFFAFGILGFSHAQDQLFYKSTTFENGDYSLILDDAVSTYGSTKFKLKIANKTADFLVLKPAECVFKINGKNSSSIDNDLVIQPNSSDSRVLTMPGSGFDKVLNYTFVMSGLYKISTGGAAIKANDFKLPPAETMVMRAGDVFFCTMDTLIKLSEKTSVTFDCLYSGDKIGMIDLSKITVKLPNGNEYPNQKLNANNPATKGKTDFVMLSKGQTQKITFEWGRMPGGKATDMSKIELVILAHDAFTETTKQRTGALPLELKYDEVKNKQ